MIAGNKSKIRRNIIILPSIFTPLIRKVTSELISKTAFPAAEASIL